MRKAIPLLFTSVLAVSCSAPVVLGEWHAEDLSEVLEFLPG